MTVLTEQFLEAVSGLFESLGRALVCLDRRFQVVHASPSLDGVCGEGAAAEIVGKPAAEVFGEDLFPEVPKWSMERFANEVCPYLH